MTERTESMPAVPPRIREFLAEPHFAAVGTVNEDGTPHQAIAWYLFDGETLVLNSADGRHWPTNLRRDPHISVAVFASENPYRFVSLTGEVEIDDDPEHGQRDIAAMAHRYHPAEKAEQQIREMYSRQRRVTFRLRPAHVYQHLD